MLSTMIPPAIQYTDSGSQASVPTLSIVVPKTNSLEMDIPTSRDSAIASPTSTGDPNLIQVLTRDHAAHPNSDELSLPSGSLVRVLTPPDELQPDCAWVLVAPVQGGESGFVPRHLLADPLSVMTPSTPSKPHPNTSPVSPRHKVSAMMGEEARGRKPFLTSNLKSQKLSTHILRSIDYNHLRSHKQSPLLTSPAVPAGVHLTIHGADRVPAPTIPPGLPHGTTLRSTSFRSALVVGGHTISSNVHSIGALAERKGKTKCCKWTVAQPEHTNNASGQSLFGSSDGKYGESKLFARIDPAAFDSGILVELVHTFRMPGVSDTDKARLRHVSAGWAVLNLFTSPGSLVAFRKYTLTLRNKSPGHLDATEIKVTDSTVNNAASLKPATVTISLSALENKWLTACTALPSPLISSLSSLPLLLSIHHAWDHAGHIARAESGCPKQPPIADPLISWAAHAIDTPSSLPILASVWRAERKKLAVHERRDVDMATKLLRRVAAAWCTGVDGVVTMENKTAMLKQCTSLRNSIQMLTKVPAPTALVPDDGMEFMYKPFRTQEVKVWSH